MGKYVIHTRKLFLRLLSAIYLFAFCSLYLQIPGLYGEKGILPAHTQLPTKNNPVECLVQKKSLICFATYFGLSTSYMMELLALVGSILSFISFVWSSWNSSILFLVLWSFYLSLYKVGQTFLWFQWDALLLEVGFLAIFVAPLWSNSKQSYHPKDMLTMWLVKWALFRLMFASGVVKLQSGCPSWWGLTALDTHYESQCIPTALAWMMHQFPGWWQKLCVVATLLIEIPIPFLFYSPIRNHRLLAFALQVFLQVSIILTGNYNFFNLTTIIMFFSILDDIDLGFKKDNVSQPGLLTSIKRFTCILLEWIGYGALCYYTFIYFGLHLSPNGVVNSQISFSKLQFETWVQYAVPFSIFIGSFSLLLTSAEALTSSLFDSRGIGRKLTTFSTTLVYSLLALSLFGVSLVPFTSIDAKTNGKIWPVFKYWHGRTGDFEITSSYGLFRHMTGVGGRPEVILEGSNSLEGPWLEYDFPYKPGKVDHAPQYIIPHQPRVDWQMWFAALGTYSQNPWLVSMSYRLLSGEKTVTKLLDDNSPWREAPPTYIRGLKYTYHFTLLTDPNKSDSDWWTRKLEGEYMPVFSVDHRPLIDYLKKLSYIGSNDSEISFKPLALSLDKIRDLTSFVQPHVLIWSLLVAALLIIFTKERSRYN